MRFPPTPRIVAIGTAVLGVFALVTAGVTFATIPENPPGDGFAAGLAGIFVMIYLVAGVLALAEAGLLYLVVQTCTPREWPLRLLTLGAAVGGSAVFLLVSQYALSILWSLTGSYYVLRISSAFSMGLVFVPAGLICTGLGAVLQVVDGIRTETHS